MFKFSLAVFFIVFFGFCENKTQKLQNVELIFDSGKQNSLFQNLIRVTNYTIPEEALDDSLSFLLLPVSAACPYCRRKTIDSIVKYEDRLSFHQYIIISGDVGRKSITALFKEENQDLPMIKDKLFLDTTNEAFKSGLVYDKPTMYYTYKRKAYKKISSIPKTIKKDLHHFFSKI